MRLVRDFEERRGPDRADGITSRDRIPGGDRWHDGEIGILRNVAVRVVDDDRRPQIFVVIDGCDRSGAGCLDRRTDRGCQIDARVRAPVLRRRVIAQGVNAVAHLRLAADRPDAHALRRLAHRVLLHGGCRCGLLGWRSCLGGIFLGRLPVLFRVSGAGRNRQGLARQGILLGNCVGYEQIARNSYCTYTEEQDYVVALFPEEFLDPLQIRMIFVVLHCLHLRG